MLDYGKSWARRLAINTTTTAALALCGGIAFAQTVTKIPVFVANQQWNDLGNGPLDMQGVEGAGALYSSLGSGVGSTSGSSTTLTLTGTPAIAPCVGCIISGAGITSGTTVSAFNGTTTITLSAAMTVASSTPLAWGAACPAATAANVPGVNPNTVASLSPPVLVRAAGNQGGLLTLPFYTQARICAYGGQQAGFTLLYFAIGAH
jgi:hypothetical protein